MNPSTPCRPPSPPIWHRLLPWAALLLAGCAGSSGLATTREYYRDAQLCRSQNLITSKVKANIGNVSATELKTGVDTTGYLRCLAQRGWTQQAASDPLLVALAKCHDRAERPARATRQQGTTRLGASLDRTAFQECLRQRGVQGEVSIEPLETVEPTQP
ncbi:hypothetical protein [Candidatus Methylocalor cossyra]|uniref:Lipoprotein n=1 Tax=Candidatus Methylocalor cossyra TaxID=3108543 RepID=A0ABM9NGW4_9GAMM